MAPKALPGKALGPEDLPKTTEFWDTTTLLWMHFDEVPAIKDHRYGLFGWGTAHIHALGVREEDMGDYQE